MRNFKGKVYWLVGASEGLGAALAHELSAAGAEVVLTARSKDRLEALAAKLPGPSRVEVLDITDADALQAAADRIGEMDGVVHMAGVYWPFGAKAWKADQANLMADVNFGGAMKLMGVVVPQFVARDRGHIVLTGSLSGYRGLPDAAAYVASKTAVMALAESLYADLRKTGVDVQLVNPGFVKTRLTDKNSFDMPFIMEPEEAAKAFFKHMRGNRFQLAFPRLFSLVFRGSQLLPDWLYYRVFA